LALGGGVRETSDGGTLNASGRIVDQVASLAKGCRSASGTRAAVVGDLAAGRGGPRAAGSASNGAGLIAQCTGPLTGRTKFAVGSAQAVLGTLNFLLLASGVGMQDATALPIHHDVVTTGVQQTPHTGGGVAGETDGVDGPFPTSGAGMVAIVTDRIGGASKGLERNQDPLGGSRVVPDVPR